MFMIERPLNIRPSQLINNQGNTFPQSIASQQSNSLSKSIKQIISVSWHTLHRRVQYVLTLKIPRVVFISTKRHHFRIH
jgi:hypothetical protein